MIFVLFMLASCAIMWLGDIATAAHRGRVFGYIRMSTDKQSLSPEVQRQTIVKAAAANGLTVDAWFQDAPTQNPDGSFNDAASGKIPIAERKAGKKLCDRLKKGDLVIVAKIDRGFRRLSDLVIMLDRWERIGVNLLMCDFPMLTDLTNPFQKAFVQMVGIFAEIERKLISQRIREALALKKRVGHAYGPWAGYGYKGEKRWDRDTQRHVKHKVRNDAERGIMAQIVKWRLDSYSWDVITSHLYAQGVVTEKGKPWSRARVMRGFQAELVLQGSEMRGN